MKQNFHQSGTACSGHTLCILLSLLRSVKNGLAGVKFCRG